MQSILFEQPWIIGTAGAVLIALALFAWLQLASKPALYVAAAALVVTLGLIALNLRVETDRESLEKTLHHVASLLRVNDYEAVYEYIHPNAVEGVAWAKGELPRYKFSDARVTRIRELNINPDTTPPTAIATFMVVVDVSLSGQINYRGPRLVRVYFMLADGKWKMRDYEHMEPIGKGFPEGDAARRFPGT